LRHRGTGRRIFGEPGTETFENSFKMAAAVEPASDSAEVTHTKRLDDYVVRAIQFAGYRAKHNGLGCDLTRSYLKEIVAKQNGVCALTGLPFDTTVREKSSRPSPYQPSLDRIDCKLGYVPGNVRVVCFAVNVALNEWGENVFLRIATAAVHTAMVRELAVRSQNLAKK
jgi:hypothetical protein